MAISIRPSSHNETFLSALKIWDLHPKFKSSQIIIFMKTWLNLFNSAPWNTYIGCHIGLVALYIYLPPTLFSINTHSRYFIKQIYLENAIFLTYFSNIFSRLKYCGGHESLTISFLYVMDQMETLTCLDLFGKH